MTDKRLIAIAKGPVTQYRPETRITARMLLKTRGYRFIGDRVEYDPDKDQRTKIDRGQVLNLTPDKLKKEGRMRKTTCEVDGCEKYTVLDGRCCSHFAEKHGITVNDAKREGRVFRQTKRDGVVPGLKPGTTQYRKIDSLAAQAGDTLDDGRFIAGPPAPDETKGPYLVLDLTEYPAIHRIITERAKEEFRTPEMQAIYLLNHGIMRDMI